MPQAAEQAAPAAMEQMWQGVQAWAPTALDWLVASGLRVLLVLVGVWVGAKLARRGIEAWSRRAVARAEAKEEVELTKRLHTLAGLAKLVATLAIAAVGGAVVLGELGVNLGPILATAGVLGLAVGFGAQSLVKDVISGLFMLVENQFNVGDVATLGGVTGVVERSTLRLTVLRDLEGRVHYVPNGQVGVVTNYTKHWSRALLDIGVAYKEDVDHVNQVLTRVGAELADDPDFRSLILEPLEILGVDAFADSAVVIKVMFKTKPLQQWAVAREFRRRIKQAFDAEGIEIPFPHRTVYLGEAPTEARLQVELSGRVEPGGGQPAGEEGGGEPEGRPSEPGAGPKAPSNPEKDPRPPEED
jgi:small conductance mechanosensitive channel